MCARQRTIQAWTSSVMSPRRWPSTANATLRVTVNRQVACHGQFFVAAAADARRLEGRSGKIPRIEENRRC
jgi:hypothetical protein